MKRNGIFFAIMLGIPVLLGLFSCTYAATTPQGRTILNNLRNEGRTDKEIKNAISDLGYNADDYFSNTNNNVPSILSNLQNIIYDESSYTARSCKVYSLKYIDEIDAYTSPDLQKSEYFINIDYLKRYIDSRNPQQIGCPTNDGQVILAYNDYTQDNERYISPNGKIYFLYKKDGLYYSTNLSNSRGFTTISELKNYIRNRNSLTILTK